MDLGRVRIEQMRDKGHHAVGGLSEGKAAIGEIARGGDRSARADINLVMSAKGVRILSHHRRQKVDGNGAVGLGRQDDGVVGAIDAPFRRRLDAILRAAAMRSPWADKGSPAAGTRSATTLPPA